VVFIRRSKLDAQLLHGSRVSEPADDSVNNSVEPYLANLRVVDACKLRARSVEAGPNGLRVGEAGVRIASDVPVVVVWPSGCG